MRDLIVAVPERLARLDHAAVGWSEFRLTRCLPHRFSGWRQFSLHLVCSGGFSQQPVLWGLFSVGGKGVPAWIECDYRSQLTLQDGTDIDLDEAGLHVPMFAALADILPPNGHVMVAYEGPQHVETQLGIRMGLPVAATRLGAVLFEAGFRGGFKDWYFAEGGHEGAVKLQANKPHDAAHARAVIAVTRAELRAYLQRPMSELYQELHQCGRERAQETLTLLDHTS